MVTGYAPEYSQENQAKLVQGYNALQNPAADEARRKLAQTLAGTAGMYGGARNAGLGQIASQQLQNTGQYAQNLAQTGVEAGRQERLTAEGRAYEDPYRQASLTGMYNGQQTMQASQYDRSLELQKQGMTADQAFRQAQLEEQQRQYNVGATGMINGQDTLAKTLANQQFGLQQAQTYLPYQTQGYLTGTQGSGTGPGGYNLQTEAQLQENTPENKFAKSLGLPNGLSLSTLASSDPGAFQQLLKTGKLPADYAGGSFGTKAEAPASSGGGKFD